jgi:hypothetical protein
MNIGHDHITSILVHCWIHEHRFCIEIFIFHSQNACYIILVFSLRETLFSGYFLGHATHGFPDNTRSIIFHSIAIIGKAGFIGLGAGEINFDWTISDGVTVFCLNTIFMKN